MDYHINFIIFLPGRCIKFSGWVNIIMEWTRRKAMIIYIAFLFICFVLGATLFSKNNIVEYEIICESGEVERFNMSDKYICGGHPNPVRNNIIDKFK